MKQLRSILICIIVVFPITLYSQDSTKVEKLSIVFAGDIMGHDGQITGAFDEETGTYNYEPTFRFISDYVSEADIAVANLEVTLAGKPYSGYPQFSSPDNLALAARDAGFDILLTANNHCLDRGKKGLIRTIQMLDSFNIVHTGTFINPIVRQKTYPLIIEKNGIRLAILNYTYSTNGISIDTPYVVNRIDTSTIRRDIKKAIEASPDYIICTLHWGIEYENDENSVQRSLANYILRQGVDIIIGSHPHVIQPIKYMDIRVGDSILHRPVVYSMGNFVSNQRAQYKDGGIMTELHLTKSSTGIKLDSLLYLPYWVYRDDKTNKSTFYVIPVSRYETDSSISRFSNDDLIRFNSFTSDTRSHITEVKESSFYTKKHNEFKLDNQDIKLNTNK